MDEHIFHKFWVIESLRTSDLKTGTHLFQDQLAQTQMHYPHLEIAHETPVNKAGFLDALATIRDEAESHGIYPMLHFDCHGDLAGIQTTNGDYLPWDELRNSLIEINYACRLNLVIVIAACNGIYLINVCTKLDRAPFYAAIGPTEKVSAGNVQRDFTLFYEKFFENLSGDEAMHAINQGKVGADRTYHFFTSFGLFAKAYRWYQDEFCSGKGRRERTENLLTEALAYPDVKKWGLSAVRRKLKKELADEDRLFLGLRDKFFFIDSFPENADRFGFSRKQILAAAALEAS